MNNIEFEQFETFDKVFSICLRGIEDHLKSDVPNPDLVMDTLCYMQDNLHNLIESFRNPENEKHNDSFADKYYSQIIAAYNSGIKDGKAGSSEEINDLFSDVCDSCDKALSSTTQSELDEHCRVCPLGACSEGRC